MPTDGQRSEQPARPIRQLEDRSLDKIVLHLVLSFDWFHQVLSGNKTVEYRRICPNWSLLIWSRRDEIKTVVFHKGYTDTTIACDVDEIDIGPCPYAGWNENYYRIHFRMQNNAVRDDAPCAAYPGWLCSAYCSENQSEMK